MVSGQSGLNSKTDGTGQRYVDGTGTDRRDHRLLGRAVDLLVAVPALLLTLPIVIVAAIAVRLGGDGPVFQRRERLGKDGEHFEMLTLRISSIDDERDGVSELDVAPPASVVGRILHATSVDDLPKLWNVVRGEMRVIGPPPLPPSSAELGIDDLDARLSVPPGLIGTWQGLRQ